MSDLHLEPSLGEGVHGAEEAVQKVTSVKAEPVEEFVDFSAGVTEASLHEVADESAGGAEGGVEE
jgi:hypothetical protein